MKHIVRCQLTFFALRSAWSQKWIRKLELLYCSNSLLRQCVLQTCSLQKQTKNRNETGSNLSLGTRLTVLSKRLGRKRCCDATPDRCLGGVSSHYLRFTL